MDVGRLRIARVDLRRVRLPLVRPVRTALGTFDERDVLLVRVVGAGSEEGWGECAAESAPGYWHEFTDGCEQVLRRFVLPRIDGADVGPGDVPVVGGWPMATAAVEWAVLDALCRRAGVSAASWLGGTRASVEATLTVGVGEPVDPGAYRNVKVKVEPGTALEPVPGVRLSADANGSLALADVERLADVDGLDHVEQPLPADDLVGHAEARRHVRVALDESIRSAGDVRTAAALGACDIVVLKPGRVGGPLGCIAVHDAAVAAGLAVKVGGMWDTGVGRAAALAVAALPGCTVPPDLAASDRYFATDIVATPARLSADGTLEVPTGPGLGITITNVG